MAVVSVSAAMARLRGLWRRGDLPGDRAGGRRDSGADADALFEGLGRVLTMADQFPRDAAGDRVRRAVCELIESNAGRDQHKCVQRVLAAIAHVEKQHKGAGGLDTTVAGRVTQLRAALRHGVVPVLRTGS